AAPRHSAHLVAVRPAISTDPLRLHEGPPPYYRSVNAGGRFPPAANPCLGTVTVTRSPCGSWWSYAIEPPPADSSARVMDRPSPDPLTFWCRPLRQKRSPTRGSSSSVSPGPLSVTTTLDGSRSEPTVTS